MAAVVLITGAGGQLGRSMQAVLASGPASRKVGAEVVAKVVTMTRSQLDIADLDAVRACVAENEPTLVVNAAAYNAVDAAETDPTGAYEGNAVGPRNLALATAAAGIPIVHVSTDYVFDGRGERPYHEYDRPNPRTVYGESKLAGEVAVRELNSRHYVVRTAWLYHAEGKNFANTITGLADRDEVRVVSDQLGSPTYVPHLAAGIAELIETEAFGTYHVVNQGGASWFEFASALYDAMNLDTPVVAVSTAEYPRPAERPRYSVLTTIQRPRIALPDWRRGVADFAVAKSAAGAAGPG